MRTFQARHIERPEKEFIVEYEAPNLGLGWSSDKQQCRVLAQTEAGALAIAKHSTFGAIAFKVV
jgi:hypothetical protein